MVDASPWSWVTASCWSTILNVVRNGRACQGVPPDGAKPSGSVNAFTPEATCVSKKPLLWWLLETCGFHRLWGGLGLLPIGKLCSLRVKGQDSNL